jgi:transcription termination factor Rho
LSAEEELTVSEVEKPKATRSRVTRTKRKTTEESPEIVEAGGVAVLIPEVDPAVSAPEPTTTETPPSVPAANEEPAAAVAAQPEQSPVVETPVQAAEAPVEAVETPVGAAQPPIQVNHQQAPFAPQLEGERPRRERGPRPDRPQRPALNGEHQNNGFQQEGRFQQRDGQPRPPRQERNDRPDRNERPDRGERPERVERVERPERRPSGSHLNVAELETKPIEELHEMARGFELQGYTRMKRPDLISRLLQAQTERDGNIFGDGILEINEDGFGFLRGPRLLPSQDDIYVSQSQIRRFGLRTGDRVSGQVRPPKDNEKFFSLLRVEAVNGVDPETARRRPSFDTLTPIFPLEMIDLETQPNILSTRLLNLVAPIGKGQRGLIVSPPKAGKTLLLKAIANGITSNNPDMHLMVCLIGERPEEVTDMKRSVEGEVISSTFDEPVEDHTKVAEMALERAKRLVEAGRHVTILLDSITRLARAYNLAVPPSGRTLSGGIDPVALYPPKRFFGAARNIEGGGSLTIVATCLIDTGSRMDDVIYEEFKGTGNMELHLDRKLAERRIYPAIDIQRSGTRREELLLSEHDLRQVWTMRRMVSMLGGSEGTELMLSRLSKTGSNNEFLATLSKDL